MHFASVKANSAIRTGQTKVREVLAAGGDVTADADARKFLEDYTFPSMTQTDPDTLSSLGRKRQAFQKNYLNERVAGSARAKMLDFSVAKLQAHAVDATLHPSSRVNAIVLLSQLTDRPLDRGRGQAPIASAKAFESLVGIFQGEDPKKYPEFVKVAAFTGIKNQLELNSKSGQPIDPAAKTQLLDAAMQFMAAPADAKAGAGGYWKKRQSVQMAGLLKDPKTLPALIAILDDETSSRQLKLDVVKAVIKGIGTASDAKTKSALLVSICKFAESAVASEATAIQKQIDEMDFQSILYGDTSVRDAGVEFGPGGPDTGDAATRGAFGDPGDGRDRSAVPMVELPNYQLQISRDRLRGVAIFCGQAIEGLRKDLDTKEEVLARGTSGELASLLRKTNVGLLDVERRRDADEPSVEEEDRDRRKSYADQMTEVCERSAETLGKLTAEFTAEPAPAAP
ncbi:hypothetical protein N9Y42_10000 [Mariniblastus sp.]|nr:hypothetical protein [Mariniblastus sp.]